MRFLNIFWIMLLALYGCNDSMRAANTVRHLSFTMVKLEQQITGGCPAESPRPTCLTISLSYPEMSSNTDPAMAKQLNQFIYGHILGHSSQNADTPNTLPKPDLEKLALAFLQEYQPVNSAPDKPWSLERSMEITFNTEELVTFLFKEHSHTGRAHPTTVLKQFVRSRENGNPIELADLLAPGYETPLNVVAEQFFRESRGLTSIESLAENGFSFDNDVFALNKNFGIQQEGLKFIFEAQEIAPYAAGATEFTVPFEDIRALISEKGLLRQLAAQPS